MTKKRRQQKHSKQEVNLKAVTDELASDLTKTDQELFTHLGIEKWSHPENREERLKKFGTNTRTIKKFNFFQEYLKSLFEPFNILLLIIGIGELLIYFLYRPEKQSATEQALNLVSALVIFFMVLLASITDFIQEYLAVKNSTKLIKLITNDVHLVTKPFDNCQKINEGMLANNIRRIHDLDLTVGDLVYLTTGDIVPADLRLIWTENLFVDQASLTGESDPVLKTAQANGTTDIFQASNILISDTKLVRGKALGLVLAVGSATYANRIIGFSNEVNDETDYEIGLKKVTKIILISILAFFPIVFALSGWRTGNWIASLIFAISMVVSLIPESLPAILSSNLQVGSRKMAKQEIVIKNFKCVQNLGSTTVIGTDKTGTLTTGKLRLTETLNAQGQADDEVFQQAYLSVYFQNNLANQIDEAISSGWKTKFGPFDFNHYQLLESEEFDFESRVTSVLLAENDQLLQVTKGAPSEVLARVNLDLELQKKVMDFVEAQEMNGIKVVLVATKAGVKQLVHEKLDFFGYLFFENEIKPGVKKVIKVFNKYHLALKVLTGDSVAVSEKLATDLQLKNTTTISGEQLARLGQPQKLQAAEQFGIFAKLNPLQKAEIVTSLQENKEIVTYLGDGINDVPALKKADVGISVNNGSATAKAAADVILLQKDLGILETGILEGRKIFTNAIKFIKIVVTMNFGLLITILIGSIWFDFAAMSPIQLLLQNLIYDLMNLAFVFDNVDLDYIKKPQAWNPKSILIFGLFNGIVPVLISVTNFLIVGYGFGLLNQIQGPDSLNEIQQFQTAFFLESLTTHIVLVLVYRTDKWALVQSQPSLTLGLVLFAFLGFAFFLIYVPVINETLGFRPMENSWWLLAYFSYPVLTYFLGQFSKWGYKKIFHQWI